MSVQFLEKNPFFLLDVSPVDSRATIIRKAEERSFFVEESICEEAQASLLSPPKRLSAEMDWFCDCEETQLSNIRESITHHVPINTDNLSEIDQLNASLYNFAIASYDDLFEIGYAILDIDEQYCAISSSELVETLNKCHCHAGLLTVSENDVEYELIKKREQIRNLIILKTKELSEEDYIELITKLAEKCVTAEENGDGIILADSIDQYELKMQPAIEAASNDVSTHIDRIKRITNKEGIEANISGLTRRLKKWDRLVQPLQLKSMASGATDNTSERIGYEVRELCLWLHNEQGMTEAALSLVDIVKDIFAEIETLAEVFCNDAKTLNSIIGNHQEAEEIIAELNSIKATTDNWKEQSQSSDSVDRFIARVEALNAKIKQIDADKDTITKLRRNLCISAREGAVSIHNQWQQTSLALSITRMLIVEFSDIEDLSKMLSEDVSALTWQEYELARSNTRSTRASQYNSGISLKDWLKVTVVLALIITVVFATTKSNSSKSGSSGSKSAYEQTSEVKFSTSLSSGEDVYADIVSIFPAIGIYTQGSSNYSHFVCECKTVSGSTIWVYMTTDEYKTHFDPYVSTSINNDYQDEKTFSSAKKFHGQTRNADYIMYDLSTDIGTTLLMVFDSVG